MGVAELIYTFVVQLIHSGRRVNANIDYESKRAKKANVFWERKVNVRLQISALFLPK